MYDYIIVGGGSAGCVLASRLTEDPGKKVLLIEAGGPDDRPEIHIPAGFAGLFRSDCDWAYRTEPQEHLDGRSLYWPRGKVLGGSSSINAMIYMRGHPGCYDRWEKAGNPGWGWADALRYFKRSENQERGASEHHAIGGPLNVADPRDLNPSSVAFLEACSERGLTRNDDFNGSQQDGFGFYQVTQKDGRRCSAAVAYLHPAMQRPNLKVETRAHAARILFSGTRAVGISYLKDGVVHEAKADGEILLAGGAINSPQLLMLSGIGPADHLAALDIPVVADLPGVGQNLQDHLTLIQAYHCKQPISLANAATPEAMIAYQQQAKGPLSSNIAEAGGFIRTRPDLPMADIQLVFAPVWFLAQGAVQMPGHGITFAATLLLPASRGSIRLGSRNPLDPPRIQPNYLAEKADVDALVSGMKLIREIAGQKALGPFLGEEHTPGAKVQSDAEIRAWLRTNVETLYHPAGTCKMGVDPLAVVDPALKVRGVEGLRVVDASIMPLLMNGNTNAPTIMIAEKASDMIKLAWQAAR